MPFVIYRQDVRPFTDKQIELVQNFAAQAVIAIENTRLLDELRESLQQQTATSEVLKAISTSAGELQAVFGTMLAESTELCEASYATLWLREGDGFRATALHGDLPPAWVEQWRSKALYHPPPNRLMARTIEAQAPVQIADMRHDPSYLEGDPLPVAAVEIAGIRTLLSVPLIKEDELVGVIAIYRKEVRPFTDKQIALVQNFAAQAVIAIENARLLNELRQRTDDLTESLEQQTATSEVLKVISSSPGELEPVFSAMLESATRICEAHFGNLMLFQDGVFRVHAMCGAAPTWVELRQREPVVEAGPLHPFTRVIKTKQLQHIADMRGEEGYLAGERSLVQFVETAGARTNLIVPMLKENDLIGAIAIYRQEVRPFTEEQIGLVQNFAAQAVIAIENTRLLNELRESAGEADRDQRGAEGHLQFAGQSPTGVQLPAEERYPHLGAKFGNLLLHEDGAFRRVAVYGAPPAWADVLTRNPLFRPGPHNPIGQMLDTHQVVHVPDMANRRPAGRLCAGEQGDQYPGPASVPRPSINSIHGALHRTSAGAVARTSALTLSLGTRIVDNLTTLDPTSHDIFAVTTSTVAGPLRWSRLRWHRACHSLSAIALAATRSSASTQPFESLPTDAVRMAANNKCLACVRKQPRTSADTVRESGESLPNELTFFDREPEFRTSERHG